ncbi:hypothetical protein BD779DRAFT_1672233 [Infundibulicybe gibba]|nr:hypothetical protein BD779DRAFT_1672233 [Infundibulicybe gibba]
MLGVGQLFLSTEIMKVLVQSMQLSPLSAQFSQPSTSSSSRLDRASTVLYKSLLEAVPFTNTQFHDTISRGRLLNRFGKDFEGSTVVCRTTLDGVSFTIGVVGGAPFVIVVLILGPSTITLPSKPTVHGRRGTSTILQFYKIYDLWTNISRYAKTLLLAPTGETISGASSKFLRDTLLCVDANSNPYYWMLDDKPISGCRLNPGYSRV